MSLSEVLIHSSITCIFEVHQHSCTQRPHGQVDFQVQTPHGYKSRSFHAEVQTEVTAISSEP